MKWKNYSSNKTMYYDNRPISEINAILDALQETRKCFEGWIESLENSTYLGEEEVEKNGEGVLVPKNEGEERVLDPDEQEEALAEYREQLSDTNRVIIQLTQVRHLKVMKEVKDSDMIQSLSAKLKRYLDSCKKKKSNKIISRLKLINEVLGDAKFLFSTSKTLFEECERREYHGSNHMEQSGSRPGSKYDQYFRRILSDAQIDLPQSRAEWVVLTSAFRRLTHL